MQGEAERERFPLRRRNPVAAMPGIVGALVGGEEAKRRGEQATDLFKVRGRAARKNAFSLAKASSIGLKSGL